MRRILPLLDELGPSSRSRPSSSVWTMVIVAQASHPTSPCSHGSSQQPDPYRPVGTSGTVKVKVARAYGPVS